LRRAPLLLPALLAGVAPRAEAQTAVRIMSLGDSITAGPGCCSRDFTYDENREGHSGFAITGIADANRLDGRTLTVGGVALTCGHMPLTRAADGYFYFSVGTVQFPWAGLFAW
jgi:hypothetical protein